MGTSHPYKRLIIKISYSPRVLPESPMRDSNIVWLIFGPRKDKHHIFILNLLKLVYGHTSLGYKDLKGSKTFLEIIISQRTYSVHIRIRYLFTVILLLVLGTKYLVRIEVGNHHAFVVSEIWMVRYDSYHKIVPMTHRTESSFKWWFHLTLKLKEFSKFNLGK